MNPGVAKMIRSKSLSQSALSLWERVGVRASDRRSLSRKRAAIRATLTPGPSPAERERGGCGIGSETAGKGRPGEHSTQPGKKERYRLIVASVILIAWIISLMLMASLT